MITQGFGSKTATLRVLAGNSLSIPLPASNLVRHITSIIATYSPEFDLAYPNFAMGRLAVIKEIFNNPNIGLFTLPTDPIPDSIGETIFDSYLWEMTTKFSFSQGEFVLEAKQDYTVMLMMPVESDAYQNFAVTTYPPLRRWQATLTVLGVGVNAKTPFDKLSTIQNA